MRVEPSQILLKYYVRFDKLIEMHSRIDVNCSYVNIYIDILDMLKSIYENVDFMDESDMSIAAGIINMAAHYRFFYSSRFRLKTRIYLIYADESINTHALYNPSFSTLGNLVNKVNYSSLNKIILKQLDIVKLLTKYINGIYYIHSQYSFAQKSFDLICQNLNENDRYILISHSKYIFQNVAMGSNRIYLIRPRKYFSEDISYLVDYYSIYSLCYNKLTDKHKQMLCNMDPKMIPIIWSCNGIEDKNIKSSMNITTCINMLSDALHNNRLVNAYQPDPNIIYNALYGIDKYMDLSTFIANYKSIELMHQIREYKKSLEYMDTSWNIDLKDPETMRSLNYEYFKNHPLNLDVF